MNKERKNKEIKNPAEKFEIGTVCEKTAGSEKGKICVIISKMAGNFVLIDGNVRRRKCNIAHLKPIDRKVKIKKEADSKKVKETMRKVGIEIESKIKLKERLRKQKELRIEKSRAEGAEEKAK